jgi:rubrerythrin
MGVSLLGSETRRNLMRAFAGECQARNRYTMAAELAGQQQLEVVSQVFLYTAKQELAHAKVFYDFLKPLGGSTVEIDGTYPVDDSASVVTLLRAAEHNEGEECSKDYPAFAKTATEEGFPLVGKAFEMIAQIEGTHGQRFGQLAQMLEEKRLFVSQVETGWICLHCGHILQATAAPALCPVCKHDQGYFVRLGFSPWSAG